MRRLETDRGPGPADAAFCHRRCRRLGWRDHHRRRRDHRHQPRNARPGRDQTGHARAVAPRGRRRRGNLLRHHLRIPARRPGQHLPARRPAFGDPGLRSRQASCCARSAARAKAPASSRTAPTCSGRPNGQIGVVQAWPGKIVMITPEGDPGSTFALPYRDGGGLQSVTRGAGHGENMILAGTAWTREDGKQLQFTYLKAYDAGGNELATYQETSRETQFGDYEFIEEEYVDFQRRWAVAPDGRVAAALSFEDYRIHVWNADGTLDRIIERPGLPGGQADRRREGTLPDHVRRLHPLEPRQHLPGERLPPGHRPDLLPRRRHPVGAERRPPLAGARGRVHQLRCLRHGGPLPAAGRPDRRRRRRSRTDSSSPATGPTW